MRIFLHRVSTTATKMNNIILILTVCFLFGRIDRGLCTATLESTDANGDDYDYDGDYDINKSDGSGVNTQVVSKEVVLDPPYFEQSKLEQYANPGDDVLMNCDVRNFRIKNVAMWYKESTVIVNGQFAINHRAESMKNNSILIKNVQAEDSGDYYCVVLPENIRLHTSLIIRGRLVIFCDGRDVTDRSLIFRQGESHTFECKTFKSDEQKITWSFNGQRAENIATEVFDGKMYIDNFDVQHAGIYQCLADNGSQDPPHGMVTIDVQYIPKVSTHRHYVNTESGKNAELYCDYKANPIAITRWLKDNHLLSYSDKYSIQNMIHKSRNRTLLTVNNVNAADLGEYKCEVENSIGVDDMKAHLIFEPEIPQFENMKIEDNKVTLNWLVKSFQPLSEAVLDYKMTGSYTWSTASIIQTQRHAELSGVWKVAHEMELMPGDWHTRVKTKNTVGWSKFSVQHEFKIKDANGDSSSIADGIPPEDMVMTAGIGLGKPQSSGCGQLQYKNSVLVVAFLFIFFVKKPIQSIVMSL